MRVKWEVEEGDGGSGGEGVGNGEVGGRGWREKWEVGGWEMRVVGGGGSANSAQQLEKGTHILCGLHFLQPHHQAEADEWPHW